MASAHVHFVSTGATTVFHEVYEWVVAVAAHAVAAHAMATAVTAHAMATATATIAAVTVAVLAGAHNLWFTSEIMLKKYRGFIAHLAIVLTSIGTSKAWFDSVVFALDIDKCTDVAADWATSEAAFVAFCTHSSFSVSTINCSKTGFFFALFFCDFLVINIKGRASHGGSIVACSCH